MLWEKWVKCICEKVPSHVRLTDIQIFFLMHLAPFYTSMALFFLHDFYVLIGLNCTIVGYVLYLERVHVPGVNQGL